MFSEGFYKFFIRKILPIEVYAYLIMNSFLIFFHLTCFYYEILVSHSINWLISKKKIRWTVLFLNLLQRLKKIIKRFVTFYFADIRSLCKLNFNPLSQNNCLIWLHLNTIFECSINYKLYKLQIPEPKSYRVALVFPTIIFAWFLLTVLLPSI